MVFAFCEHTWLYQSDFPCKLCVVTEGQRTFSAHLSQRPQITGKQWEMEEPWFTESASRIQSGQHCGMQGARKTEKGRGLLAIVNYFYLIEKL